MKVDVRFDSGRDVLNAYWGYLSDGGLVISHRSALDVGQNISLDVRIASSNSRYSFSGKVVKHQPDGRTVIAFRPGEPHDMLLTEALAETDQVPARRHRRFTVDSEAHIAGSEIKTTARLVNISASGCCLRLAAERGNTLAVGTAVEVQSAGFRANGTVVWTRHTERGVRFDHELPDVEIYAKKL